MNIATPERPLTMVLEKEKDNGMCAQPKLASGIERKSIHDRDTYKRAQKDIKK